MNGLLSNSRSQSSVLSQLPRCRSVPTVSLRLVLLSLVFALLVACGQQEPEPLDSPKKEAGRAELDSTDTAAVDSTEVESKPTPPPELPAAQPLGPTYYADLQPGRCCTVIAHAGGAIDGNPYSNSVEALEANYAIGVRIFEIDFQLTSDNHWVATHDWPLWQRRSGYTGELPPSLTTFSASKLEYKKKSWSIPNTYTPISLAWLNTFLSAHPDAVIVTDTKELDLFESLVRTVLAQPTRSQFIVQAYYFDHVDLVKSLDPSARVILTLYRKGARKSLYNKLPMMQQHLWGITLPMSWADRGNTLTRLKESGVPLFLHGSPTNINSRALHAKFEKRGVTGFYLD